MITVLVLLGQVLELRARRRTGNAIRSLLDLAPPTARLVPVTAKNEVPLGEVKAGDHLRVRPGEKIPVDGQRHRRPDDHRRIDDHGRSVAGRKELRATK